MSTYYYTPEEREGVEIIAKHLNKVFDFGKCHIHEHRVYGAQSFATFSYGDVKIRKICARNFYKINGKELFCKERCYLVDGKFYVIRNGEVLAVKKDDVLTLNYY